MDKIRIIIADNHPAFRDGLARLLSDENDLEVVGQAADGEEAVKLTSELKPDVAISEVRRRHCSYAVEVPEQVDLVSAYYRNILT